MSDPRYPIGKFQYAGPFDSNQRSQLIESIEEAPAKLRAALEGLSLMQLDTPYREGGWTPRQVAHHVPESHMNAYTRFKLALTEENPLIKPYMENLWAELPDVKETPVETSLALLEALHKRWVIVLRTMKPEHWQRSFRHPELGTVSLDRNLALYAWHGQHHIAHITSLRERMGW
jgi:DinB superfamily